MTARSASDTTAALIGDASGPPAGSSEAVDTGPDRLLAIGRLEVAHRILAGALVGHGEPVEGGVERRRCNSGGYQRPSAAIHRPGYSDPSLIPGPVSASFAAYGAQADSGNDLRPPPGGSGQESGWATKNAHMVELALIAVVCGPRERVNTLRQLAHRATRGPRR